MKYTKSQNLCKIRRGFKIPQTKVSVYAYNFVGGVRIYTNDDEPYYHGKKDLMNTFETYISNNTNLGIQVGTRIFVKILQGNITATFNFKYRGL